MKLFTLEGAAALFAGLAELDHVHHEALEKAAEVVEKQAKDYIGTYDAKPTWPPLAASTLEKKGADTPLLQTGELLNSIHHVADHKEACIGSDHDRAVWHELGTAKIPPRPFLEPALKEKTAKVLEIIGLHVVGKLSGTER
jgi:phage gpG-like protein